MKDIIDFYKTFDRYKQYSDFEIASHIKHSYKSKQYKVFRDGEIYGFTNWAFLDKSAKDKFLQTGNIDDWNCGDEMIHIDLLANKNVRKVYKWSKNNLAKNVGLGKITNWIRIDENNVITNIVNKQIKETWLNG